MSTTPPRVLVTGATGFIGRRLCARLRADGAHVVALARTPAPGPWDEFVPADLGAGAVPAPAVAGVACAYHLAGRAHALSERRADDDAYRRANVEGTRALVDALVAAEARALVLVSSVKAVGEGGPRCIDEDDATPPATAYGRSKREAEAIVTAAAARGALHAVALRLPLVYGPGVGGNLDRMLRAVRARRFPPPPENGNRRSLCDVDDAIEAARLAAARPAASGRTYIVTDGRAYSTRRIYELMCAALGRAAPRWAVPAAALGALAALGDAAGAIAGRRMPFDGDALDKLLGSAWYSSARIERELGFRPRGSLEHALPAMVAALDAAGAGPADG